MPDVALVSLHVIAEHLSDVARRTTDTFYGTAAFQPPTLQLQQH